MLRPQDTTTRERKRLDGLWRFALDPAGEGRAGTVVRRTAGGHPRDGGTGQLQRHRGRSRGPRPRRRRLVRDHGPGAARLGRPADRAAVRVGDPPGHGLRPATPRWSRTRAATRRSRPTSATTSAPARSDRITVVVNNRAELGSRFRRAIIEETPDGPRQRYFHDFFNYAGLHRPVWLYATASGPHQRRHRDHRARGRCVGHRGLRGRGRERRATPRSASRCATRRRARSLGPPGSRRSFESRTRTCGGRVTATSTTSRSSCVGDDRTVVDVLLAGDRASERSRSTDTSS